MSLARSGLHIPRANCALGTSIGPLGLTKKPGHLVSTRISGGLSGERDQIRTHRKHCLRYPGRGLRPLILLTRPYADCWMDWRQPALRSTGISRWDMRSPRRERSNATPNESANDRPTAVKSGSTLPSYADVRASSPSTRLGSKHLPKWWPRILC